MFFEFSFEVTPVAPPPDSSQWIYLLELHINNAQFFPIVSWSHAVDNWVTKHGDGLTANKIETSLCKCNQNCISDHWLLLCGNVHLAKRWQQVFVQLELILSCWCWRFVNLRVCGDSQNVLSFGVSADWFLFSWEGWVILPWTKVFCGSVTAEKCEWGMTDHDIRTTGG